MSKLIDEVLDLIKDQIQEGDVTAVEELLTLVPRENLIQFLPEEEWHKYPQSINFITEE